MGGMDEPGTERRNLVDGRWVEADSGRMFEVRDPATDDVIARVPSCGRSETRRAIEAADNAFEPWRARPAFERSRMLRAIADMMIRDEERLANLMTREQGKPLAEARAEVVYAASFIEWAAGEGMRLYGEMVPASLPDKRILVLRQPIGVTACITPWNFPIAMITRKLGPALAAGNTIVVKPAEETPLSALAFGELAVLAGIPAGVINIVTGDAEEIGEELLANPIVRKLSFTGSTETGKVLIRKSAQNVTRLSLELGGHAPFVVFDDADIDAAVAGALATKYRNAGQTCICANRFYVQNGVYDEFAEKLSRAVARMQVGRGTDHGVEIGPLISDDALEKVERHVADAVARGGRVRQGGTRVRVEGLADRFYAPTVIDDFSPQMLLAHEETFGPVAPLCRFSSEADAISMANDSIYGLAAYFYTRDAGRLMRVAERLEYGIVGANDGTPSTAQAPFGGVKQSGYGREGGRYVMDEYTQIKYVSWQL
jgi:succinate-semialdehyde dehydrogenase / glutarate-semialdehyde dehydrogenase